MNAEERREDILLTISRSDVPVSASYLKDKTGVSRQVIVRDIAYLKEQGHDIISTPKGYLLGHGAKNIRVFKCRHSFDDILIEGNIVVECGGSIKDVFVNHRVYGKICAKLDISTKRDVEELYRSLMAGASKPLMSVTDGYHYHTVAARAESDLDLIEEKLRDMGFLV